MKLFFSKLTEIMSSGLQKHKSITGYDKRHETYIQVTNKKNTHGQVELYSFSARNQRIQQRTMILIIRKSFSLS